MTPRRCLALRVFAVAFLLILLSPCLRAQNDDAHITGIVTDPSKAIIRGAKVDLINVDTGVHHPAITNDSGVYRVSGQVGSYRIEVDHPGFKTVIEPGIVLHTQDALEINFEMALGSASESVTVKAETTNTSPAVSMTVDREFVENVPLNGRSFQDLIQLAPGVVSDKSGNYSVDGQRTDSNIFTVDGVSANLGGFIDEGTAGGSGLSGYAPMQTALGTTQSLASLDSLQEFKIQTSGYTAEYGRSPGGQVQFTTRSGTNNIHGLLFEYFRNTALDANTDENDYYGYPKTAEHQNDFGGTVGGPFIVPKIYNGTNKTFYFFSYEGLRLLQPASESEYVPTQAFRNWASPNVQPFLNAAPLPNPSSPGNEDGCMIPGTSTPCDALFYYGFSYPNKLDNISIRIDQNLGSRFHAFLRYADTPSSESSGAESVETQAINTHTWTVGLTANIMSSVLNDLRFNYSHDGEERIYTQKSVGGSTPLPRNLLIPATYNDPYASAESLLEVPGTTFSVESLYREENTAQHQYQFVDSISWTRGRHVLKFGLDWRRLTPIFEYLPYENVTELLSLAAIQQGYATSVDIAADASTAPVFDNLSVYAEDHWNLGPRISIDYGLRWEFNPVPGPENGVYPAVLTSSNLATATLAPLGTPPFQTLYDKFAPRVGFAWNAILSGKFGLTIRGGAGIFYDTGQTMMGIAYVAGYPLDSNITQTNVPLPLSAAATTPPSRNLNRVPPYPLVQGLSVPNLTLPYTEQWNLSLDESLNSKNTFTLSYVGNNGRKLLFTQEFSGNPDGNKNFPSGVFLTSNGSQSSYNALQAQDIGRLSNNLDIVGSFTYAHALDNASTDSSNFAPVWGNSNYDLRRVLNLALNYQTPTAGWSRWMEAFTHGWLVGNRFSTQSGYPVNIVQSTLALTGGTEAQYSPDLVHGVSIYLHGSAAGAVPGSWRLNRGAFACTTDGATSGACTGTPTRQGTLGRNSIRTPSFWALNTAVQRSFPIYERVNVNFRAEAFNIFNHPNLQAPTTTLSSSTFGELANTNIATIGTPNVLYAMGAARSLQLSLRLQF